MRREELVDLNAFATVTEERSFTRAAAKLGTSQSALSHTINRLEARVGVRLLTRTTRNVAPTEAGERMLRALGPALDTIAEALASVRELREKPAGTIRITPRSTRRMPFCGRRSKSCFRTTLTSTSNSSSNRVSPTSLPTVSMPECGSAS